MPQWAPPQLSVNPDTLAPHSMGRHPSWGIPGPQPFATWQSGGQFPLIFVPNDGTEPEAWTTVAPYGTSSPTGTVYHRAIWQSPIFDLYPQLGESTSEFPAAQPISTNGTLFLQIQGPAVTSQPLEVYFFELAHITNPTRLGPVTARTYATQDLFDVATAATGGAPSTIGADTTTLPSYAMLRWRPPAYAPRYWCVAVVFDVVDNVSPPTLLCEAAFY